MSVFELVARAVGLERVPAVKAAAQVVEYAVYVAGVAAGSAGLDTPTLHGYATAGYGDNAMVYACIARKAESAALAPLVAYTGERTKPERVPDAHPLAALLLRPNPWQCWYEFMELLITYLELDGNAFVYKAAPSDCAPLTGTGCDQGVISAAVGSGAAGAGAGTDGSAAGLRV